MSARTALALLALGGLIGCSSPREPGPLDAGRGVDAWVRDATPSIDEGVLDANDARDAEPLLDATADDMNAVDLGADDAFMGPDADAFDAGADDGGLEGDGAVGDAGGEPDSAIDLDGGADFGADDAGADLGAADAGVDAGGPDAGPGDAGAPDAGPIDAGLGSGGVRWARSIIRDDRAMYREAQWAYDVAPTRANDGMYVVGTTQADVEFAPEDPVPVPMSSVFRQADGWLVKYSAEGRFRWVRRIASVVSNVFAFGVATAPNDGAAIVVGKWGESCIGISPMCGATWSGGGTTITRRQEEFPPLSSYNTQDGFVARYAEDGRLEWVTTLIAWANMDLRRVAASGDRIFIAGQSEYAGRAAPGTPDEIVFPGGYPFYGELDAGGRPLWIRTLGGTCATWELREVAATPRGWLISGSVGFGDGRASTCGVTFPGGLAFGRGTLGAGFLAEIGHDGSTLWATTIAGVGSASGAVRVAGVAYDTGSDTVYVTGRWCDGGSYPSELCTTEFGSTDGLPISVPPSSALSYWISFLAAYSGDGRPLWVEPVGGYHSLRAGRAIWAGSDGNILLTGSLPGTQVFGAGEPTEKLLLSECAARLGLLLADGYVASYGPDGGFQWGHSTACSEGRSIASLAGGPVVATGYFWDAAIFGEGEPSEVTLQAHLPRADTDADPYLVAYEP